MSILGAVVRTRPEHVAAVASRLAALPGVDLALNPGDGRMVVVIEDAAADDGQRVPAATTLAEVALWPEVLSASLVYEYSGPDAMPEGMTEMADYRAWRGSITSLK
jgi:nitrate reductase NapAB chaperone NapD